MERVTPLIHNEWHHVIVHRIPLITEFAKMRGITPSMQSRADPLSGSICNSQSQLKRNESPLRMMEKR
ncbi:hypothetical protein DN613_20685 [Aeromonas caviae]|nr:hypothetical protein DN613_20685 [Aeromonas caviae]